MRPAMGQAGSFLIIRSRIRVQGAMMVLFSKKRIPCYSSGRGRVGRGFINGLGRFLFEFVLAALAEEEHGESEDQQDNSPP